MEIASTDRAEREATLRRRVANVEQCLAEARAPSVRAFLEDLHHELQAELALLGRPPSHLASVAPVFPVGHDGADPVS